MERLKKFILTSVLGGVVVILPVAIMAGVIGWMYGFVTKILAPLTNQIVARADIKAFLANLIVIITIVLICFLVGVMVRTRFGKFLHNVVETKILNIAPGYNIIKETVLQLLGSKKAPFSKVVLANIFQNDTLVTAFVTDEHADGSFSVFVPTGPNPTSGNIYHLKAKYVHETDVSVEDAMRSIISCGAGSDTLVKSIKS